MATARVTKAQSRKAARHWRAAETLLSEAELLAGELATRQRSVVHDLVDEVRNARSNVGYAASEEERAGTR